MDGLERQAGGERQQRDGQRHEPDQHAAGALLVQVEDGQVPGLLALCGELGVPALAPPQADRNQREAEQEHHRQQDEGEDAEVGAALEPHALHEEQRADEQQADHDQQGADQAHHVARDCREEVLDHR